MNKERLPWMDNTLDENRKDLKYYKRTGYPCCYFTANKIYKGFQIGHYFTVIMDNGEWSSSHWGGFEEVETPKGE